MKFKVLIRTSFVDRQLVQPSSTNDNLYQLVGSLRTDVVEFDSRPDAESAVSSINSQSTKISSNHQGEKSMMFTDCIRLY